MSLARPPSGYKIHYFLWNSPTGVPAITYRPAYSVAGMLFATDWTIAHTMKKIIPAIYLLFGFTFVYAGLYKFFPALPVLPFIEGVQRRVIAAFCDVPWLMPLLATAEIAGGLLMFIPRTRAFAAVMLLPVIAGIVLHNITVDPVTLPVALAVALTEVWILYRNRDKYKPVFLL